MCRKCLPFMCESPFSFKIHLAYNFSKMSPKKGDLSDSQRNPQEIIISDEVMRRIVKSKKENEKSFNPELAPGDTLKREYEKLVESYMEIEPMNSVMEEAAVVLSSIVEKRAAAITKLKTICDEEKECLTKCYIQNQDCTLNCNKEVEKFMNCVYQQLTLVVANKVNSMGYNKKRTDREKELSNKYKIPK